MPTAAPLYGVSFQGKEQRDENQEGEDDRSKPRLVRDVNCRDGRHTGRKDYGGTNKHDAPLILQCAPPRPLGALLIVVMAVVVAVVGGGTIRSLLVSFFYSRTYKQDSKRRTLGQSTGAYRGGRSWQQSA